MRVPALLFLALASVVSAQDLSKPVTYRSVATPLRKALEEVSAQGQVKLTVSNELAQEPIIVVLRGAPLQEVMDHMASTIGAEWTKNGANGFRLERTPELEGKLIAEVARAKAETIRKQIAWVTKEANLANDSDEEIVRNAQTYAASIAGLAKVIATDGSYNLTFDQQEALVALTPLNRAFARVLPLLPIDVLSNAADGQNICLSNKPNLMELKLNGDVDSIFKKLFDEQETFSEACKSALPKDRQRNPLDRFWEYTNSFESQPTRLVLKVECGSSSRVTIVAIDDKGKPLASLTRSLRHETYAEYRARTSKAFADLKNETEVPLSSESKALRSVCDVISRGGFENPTAITPEVRAWLLDPVGHDLLSFQISDGYLALADSENVNAIGYLDDVWTSYNFAASFPLFIQHIKGWMLTTPDVTTTIQDGWMVSWPTDRVRALRSRCDRAALAECLQEGNRYGYIPISVAAELAFSERRDVDSSLPFTMSLFGPQFGPFRDRDRRLLRFYGALDEGQRKVLSTGQKLTAGNLTKEQYEHFQDYVMKSMEVEGNRMVSSDGYVPMELRSIREEMLPDGVTPSTTISMTDTQGDTYFGCLRWGGNESVMEMTIDTLAFHIADGEANPGGRFASRAIWVAPGVTHDLRFTITMGNGIIGRGSLREVVLKDDRWPMDQLPTNMQQKLDKALVGARNRAKRAAPQAAPPPPLFLSESKIGVSFLKWHFSA